MTAVYTILGLTFIIFIHELGHFLVARWCGVKVHTFSIGFGPRIITFFKDRTGTEYILSLIPLGGYVRMKGQEDLPRKLEGKQTELESDHFLAKKSWQKLLIILAGVKMNLLSAFLFVVVAFLIGIPFSSNIIAGFEPGSVVEKSDLQIGDEIVEINGVQTDTMEEIVTVIALEQGKPYAIKAVREEAGTKKDIEVVIDYSKMNRIEANQGVSIPYLGIIPKNELVIMGLDESSTLFQKGLRNGHVLERVMPVSISSKDTVSGRSFHGMEAIKYIEDNPGEMVNIYYRDFDEQVQVIKNATIDQTIQREKGFFFSSRVQVVKEYPAATAGIKNGDLITSINDNAISHWDDILVFMAKVASNDTDKKLNIAVEREDQKLLFEVTPIFNQLNSSYVIGVSPYIDSVNSSQEIVKISPEMKKLVPGLRVGDHLSSYVANQDKVEVSVVRGGNIIKFFYNPNDLAEVKKGYLFEHAFRGKNIRYGFFESLPKSFSLLKSKFSDALSFFTLLIRGKLPLEAMGGPIAIFEVSYQVVTAKGWSYFLLLMAEISVSLIIINLLPIPVLDGGHACVIIYEMIRGKPVPEKALRFFQLVGIVFLLLLIVYVNYNDFNRVFSK